MLAEMYTMILREEGFEVSQIKDGRSAVQKNIAGFDIVLLDIRLPEVDGLEVLRSYRDRGFAKPIIVLTNSPQVNLMQARKLGADGLLIKSHSNIGDVLKAIEKHLN